MLRELLGMFGMILTQIEMHDAQFPEHGKNCACMDQYIRAIRQATDSETAQERVDYVLGSAAKNRAVKMIPAQSVTAIAGRRK